MSWTAKVVTDADKSDVGMATATFTAQDESTFTYGRRAKMNAADKAAFVAEAKAALAAAAAKKTLDANLSSILETALNA